MLKPLRPGCWVDPEGVLLIHPSLVCQSKGKNPTPRNRRIVRQTIVRIFEPGTFRFVQGRRPR